MGFASLLMIDLLRKMLLGYSVAWIQCEFCNLWFHQLCIQDKDIDDLDPDSFICTYCNGIDNV